MESDPTAGVGVLAALAAGLVSFLSPCVLPLVPGYLSTVTGASVGELERSDWRKVMVPSLLFVASFSAIFIALGATASGLGSLLNDHLATLEKISAALIVSMGVFLLAALFIPMLNREWRIPGFLERAGRGSPILIGAAFAFAWTPCIGPTLAAILGLASTSDSAARGAGLLAVYSAGLAMPFLATALAFTRMTSAFTFFKRHYPAIIGAGSVILIAMGVLIWTGEYFRLNAEAQELMNDLGINVSSDV